MFGDQSFDRLYPKQGFASDRERVEHLLALYEKMATPPVLAATAPTPKPRGRAKAPGP